MNYYNEIKNKIIEEEIYSKVKDYSNKLSKELNKKISIRYLFDIRKLYLFIKVHPLGAQLTISHCRLLFKLKDNDEIDYYINQSIPKKLSKRDL